MGHNTGMKTLKENLEGYLDRMKTRQSDFPSYAHEVAWEICQYFDEPFGLWVRNVQYASINPGQTLDEFRNLMKKPFTRRQKAKMLTSTMKIYTQKRRQEILAKKEKSGQN